jgi:hypothetical protein
MRLAPRLAAAITVLVLTVAGCGGANVAYREAPGPVDLDVPGDASGVTGAATPTATPDADEEETPDADAEPSSTDPDPTPAPDTGTDNGAAADGGTEAPAAEPDDNAPPAETPAPGLEDYCAANPGAC